MTRKPWTDLKTEEPTLNLTVLPVFKIRKQLQDLAQQSPRPQAAALTTVDAPNPLEQGIWAWNAEAPVKSSLNNITTGILLSVGLVEFALPLCCGGFVCAWFDS